VTIVQTKILHAANANILAIHAQGVQRNEKQNTAIEKRKNGVINAKDILVKKLPRRAKTLNI
jgi:hypothetical protein